MSQRAAKLAKLLTAVSKLSVLKCIIDGPMSVIDVQSATGLSQPLVSAFLRQLLDANVARVEMEGRHRYYAVCDAKFASVVKLLLEAGE